MENEDVPINEENGRRVADAVAATSSTAAQMVRQHEAEHGEVLPTILLDEVGGWFVASHGADTDAIRAVDAVNELHQHGDDDIQTIVITGFLEAMPHVGHADRGVVELLPTPLRAELRRMEDGSTV
ncbi:hypothetical protein GCM10023200_16670 [Actinomycetospora chlora]|uniref:DUF7674 domain-containing protein n=1 Tax=Actinomycetospora chlora TaxID=663608 RepID=A0ABP9AN79_9PSEU